MPRDGSGSYSIPPGTEGIPDTTIESAKYNNFAHDVETDLNTPRPIVAGGTGATSATDALFNLSGEKATQVVTNYDSHVWVPGSFRSAAAATGAPNATSAFAGTCYIGEALANPPTNQNVVVEARDMDSPVKPGLLYTKQKTAGTWSAWNYAGTGDDQTAARAAIYAAPFDAMAYNGMQINGSMEVSQEYGSTAVPLVTGVNTPIIDGWRAVSTHVSTAVMGAKQFDLTTSHPVSLRQALQLTANTGGNFGGGANDAAGFGQIIEGYRWSRLAFGTASAQSVTISFWVAANIIGTMTVAIRNIAGNRSYVKEVTINAPSTWEYKTITIPGETSGVWETTNLGGANINFRFGVGTAFRTTPNAWQTGNFTGTASSTNFFATTGNFVLLAGVVVLPGIQAPTAAQSPLIMRPYGEELVTCQRYYNSKRVQIIGYTTAGSSFGVWVPHPMKMRAAPAVTFGTPSYSNSSGFTADNTSIDGVRSYVTATATGVFSADATVITDARL